ncbi:hypothetical protein EX30DRAFT_113835 [Ascodesmis nigricans]|uniref:Uncharacterized protein n=1 Tax=Ascodesmis nigricans TaxID=341454 RepID=A0A4S2MSN7_9PEZI|nr:hypothetical protein EX30DRAFT_113835 [Ascodesmis nigricans]
MSPMVRTDGYGDLDRLRILLVIDLSCCFNRLSWRVMGETDHDQISDMASTSQRISRYSLSHPHLSLFTSKLPMKLSSVLSHTCAHAHETTCHFHQHGLLHSPLSRTPTSSACPSAHFPTLAVVTTATLYSAVASACLVDARQFRYRCMRNSTSRSGCRTASTVGDLDRSRGGVLAHAT